MGSWPRFCSMQKTTVFFVVGIFAATFPSLNSANFHESLITDLYLVQLKVDTHILADNVPVYKVEDKYYINFPEFVRATEFEIKQSGGKWYGWYYSEEQTFEFTPELNEVTYNSQSEHINKEQWFFEQDELYVSMSLLVQWFDMEFNANKQQQTISLIFDQRLAFERREDVTKRKNRYRNTADNTPDALIDDQYYGFTTPRFDLNFNQLYHHIDGSGSDSTSLSYTAGMDILKHSMLLVGTTVRSDQTSVRNTSRITFERRALNHADDIFLGVDRYRFGDVYANNTNLVNRGGSGVGFFFERGDNLRAQTLGEITINGDAQAGWQLELYHNGILVEFGRVDIDGRYNFPNQETVQGENRFVVKLYGPQGQVREQVHTEWGGGADLPAGEYGFVISYQDFTRRLLSGEIDGTDALPASDLANIGLSYALTDDVQLGMGYSHTNLNTRDSRGDFEPQDYFSLNGRFALRRGLLLTDVVVQNGGNYAWEARYLGKLYGQDLSLSHQQTKDFESPFTVQSIKLDSRDSITLSGAVNSTWFTNYLLKTTYERRFRGGSDLVLFSRLGFRLGGGNLTNEYEYRHLSQGSGSHRGLLRFSGRKRNHNFSGLVNYRLDQSRPIDQVSTLWRWYINRDTFNSLQVTKSLKNDRNLTLNNEFTKVMGDFALTLYNSVNSKNDWSVGLSLDVAFGYDRAGQHFYTNGHGLANYGRLTMSPFVDTNNNGYLDLDESLIEDFTHRNDDFKTGETGHITHISVPPYTPYLIKTDQINVNDPFLVARHKVYEVDTHPGSDLKVDIPFVVTGDIEGSVYLLSNEIERGLRGIEIGLYSLDEELVITTRTQFDGYYSFSQIPVGEYQLRMIRGETRIIRKAILDSALGYVVIAPIVISEDEL